MFRDVQAVTHVHSVVATGDFHIVGDHIRVILGATTRDVGAAGGGFPTDHSGPTGRAGHPLGTVPHQDVSRRGRRGGCVHVSEVGDRAAAESVTGEQVAPVAAACCHSHDCPLAAASCGV